MLCEWRSCNNIFLTYTLFPHRDTPVFCALINGEGEVVDFLRLPYFMKRRNAFREDEREKKVQTKAVLLCSQQMFFCFRKTCHSTHHHSFVCVIFRPTTLRISRGFWPARNLMWWLLLGKIGKQFISFCRHFAQHLQFIMKLRWKLVCAEMPKWSWRTSRGLSASSSKSPLCPLWEWNLLTMNWPHCTWTARSLR